MDQIACRDGLSMVMATGGDVNLLVWDSVEAVGEGPPRSPASTLLLDQELRAAQDHGVLKTGLSLVRTALSTCAGALLMTTEAAVDISSRSEGHQPINSTLREFVSVREMNSASTPPHEQILEIQQEQEEEAAAEASRTVIDLVGRCGASVAYVDTAGLGGLMSINLSSHKQEPPGPAGVISGSLVVVRILQDDPADRKRLFMTSGEVYRLEDMRVPSLLAYTQEVRQREQRYHLDKSPHMCASMYMCLPLSCETERRRTYCAC